jgi:hypothetical protein
MLLFPSILISPRLQRFYYLPFPLIFLPQEEAYETNILSVFPQFELVDQLTDFHGTWHDFCAIGG